MTRCYEYYCMVERDPKKCLKKASVRADINRYKLALKARGVKFDYSEQDKARFQAVYREIGSEKAFLRQVGDYDKNSVILSKEDIIKLEHELNILHGDFRQKGKAIPDNNINLILTDPPYGAEYLELWDALGSLANRTLCPSSYLIAYSGTKYLPDVFASLSNHLEYFWTVALRLKERNLMHFQNIYSLWKPLVIYYKPPLKLPIEYICDVIEGQGREKFAHPWQQTEQEIHSLIKAFCPENGVILDPMAGTGTTLVAAKKLQRQYIGIELEEANLPKIAERLQTC